MNTKAIFREIPRKMVHLSGVLIVVVYTLLLNYTSQRIAILAMTGLLLLLLEIEYIRLEHKPRIVEVFNTLFRRHEKTKISAAVFLVISCIICFAAFDYWVAFLAMTMTVFGDLAAALTGKAFGKKKIYKDKTYVGTVCCLLTNIIVGFLSLPEFLWIYLPMALTATFVEVFTRKLDDNLTVPLFSGFIGQMIIFFFDITLPPVNFTFLGFFN